MEQEIEELQKRIADLCEELRKSSITDYQKNYLYMELEYARQKYASLSKVNLE